jgi:hypothetical protein
MSKNKNNSNMNLTNILSPTPHTKINSSSSPFNINHKNSYKNPLEKSKKESSLSKNKNKLKNSEVMINNYLSQRSRLNTDGNELNLKELKFSYNFLRNKIEYGFKSSNNRNTSKKINSKTNNFDNTNNNFRVTKKIQKSKNSENNNKKENTNGHITRLMGRSTNKKIIDENSHNYEYNNTNIHNRSNTQTYFRQSNKKILTNNTNKQTNHSSKTRKSNKSEDMKKRKVNNRIIKDCKVGNLRQMSPLYISNNKLSNIQNYFKNITNNKNKNLLNSNKGKYHNKERQILISDNKELNNTNKIQSDEFIVKKNNSSYLVISKKPAQITNFIEKKENNKYINNYFNICENKKGEMEGDKFDQNNYITFEEIHFFFVKQIQMGNKLNVYMGCQKS